MTKPFLTAMIVAALAAGCEDKSAGTAEGTPNASAPAGGAPGATAAAPSAAAPAVAGGLPAALRLAAAPADAKDVSAAKSSLKDGDRVVVRGVVGGRVEPIAANRAILTLLDPAIKTCDKNPGDGCTTPWDACCEPADVLAKSSVTVQVVDADGRPLKTPLTGVPGVKPMAKLVVSGTAKVSTDGVVLVNADGVFVEP